MTKATDFAPEEAELLFELPFVVAGTSLAVVHGSAIKIVKTALSLYLIVRDTSKHFPDNECIQTTFGLKATNHEGNHELIEEHQANGREAAIAIRNAMAERVSGILNEKCPAQEAEEYKRWLWQIASEVMHKAQSNGFLGFGKDRAEAEVAQELQNFAHVLQLPQ
jgi:hypothetical protein